MLWQSSNWTVPQMFIFINVMVHIDQIFTFLHEIIYNNVPTIAVIVMMINDMHFYYSFYYYGYKVLLDVLWEDVLLPCNENVPQQSAYIYVHRDIQKHLPHRCSLVPL